MVINGFNFVQVESSETAASKHIGRQSFNLLTKGDACKGAFTAKQTLIFVINSRTAKGVDNLTIEVYGSQRRIVERTAVVAGTTIVTNSQRRPVNAGLKIESGQRRASLKYVVLDCLNGARDGERLDRKMVEHLVPNSIHLRAESYINLAYIAVVFVIENTLVIIICSEVVAILIHIVELTVEIDGGQFGVIKWTINITPVHIADIERSLGRAGKEGNRLQILAVVEGIYFNVGHTARDGNLSQVGILESTLLDGCNTLGHNDCCNLGIPERFFLNSGQRSTKFDNDLADRGIPGVLCDRSIERIYHIIVELQGCMLAIRTGIPKSCCGRCIGLELECRHRLHLVAHDVDSVGSLFSVRIVIYIGHCNLDTIGESYRRQAEPELGSVLSIFAKSHTCTIVAAIQSN